MNYRENLQLIFLGLTLTFFSQTTRGATQTINFSQGAGDYLQLRSNNGDILTVANNATLFIGCFSITPTGQETAEELNAAFTQFGSSRSDITTSGVFPDGSFADDSSTPPFPNQLSYIVIANNPDLAKASELAIMTNTDNSNWSFSSGTTPTTTSIDLENDIFDAENSGAKLSFGTRVGTPNDGNPDAIQLSVVTVPEPTSLTLLGLGGVALIFNRRK
jgi:hypothetical protein